MPLPSAAPNAICPRLTAALPGSLGEGLAARKVTGDPTRSAAWGNPPVTVACGTAAINDPTSTLIQVGPAQVGEVQGGEVQSGVLPGAVVTFVVVDVDGGTAFTTSGLPVPVTITVPDAYDSTVLVPITGPLLQLDR